MKKDEISNSVLIIISFLFILSVFSYPAIDNIITKYKNYKFDKNEQYLLNVAKSKYSGDIASLNENKEYTIKELISEGLLTGKEINPITGKEYKEDDKVIVVIKNGVATYKFVDGKTLTEIIKLNTVLKNDEYYYEGLNPNNYISFNEQIYKIIKTTENNEVYIINENLEEKVELEKINNYFNTYLNDKIKEEYKKLIIKDLDVLTLKDYEYTKLDNNSYLYKDNLFWMKVNNEIKSFDFLINNFVTSQKSWINPIIVIDGTNIVTKGDGSRLNPYCIY